VSEHDAGGRVSAGAGRDGSYGEATRAVHGPTAPTPQQQPLGLPVYRTAAFRFSSAAQYADVLVEREPGFS